MNTTGQSGAPGDAIAWQVYEVFFETLKLLLGHRITLVAEAAFQHELWAAKLELLRERAQVRIVLCSVSAELARLRHLERGLADPDRERFHDDGPVKAAREGRTLPIENYRPPHLDVPTLAVDTSNGYEPAFEKIVAFAKGPGLSSFGAGGRRRDRG